MYRFVIKSYTDRFNLFSWMIGLAHVFRVGRLHPIFIYTVPKARKAFVKKSTKWMEY